jgi:hypothetical protein
MTMNPLPRVLILAGALTTAVAVGRYAAPSPVLGPVAVTAPAEPASRPAPRRCEATVYLPLADNQGRAFPEAEWEAALAGLVAPFGGATLGTAREGLWLDAERRLHREWVRPVVISFDHRRLDEYRQAVRKVGRQLRQEAVYVRFEEPRIDLIAVDAGSTREGR